MEKILSAFLINTERRKGEFPGKISGTKLMNSPIWRFHLNYFNDRKCLHISKRNTLKVS